MINSKSIIIVGAGISGISCAQTLINNNFSGKITILELGNGHLSRYCAVDNGKICANCNPCNTISGFGGSVHYGDTVKLSCFPSGRRLQDLVGIERSNKAQEIALSYFLDGKVIFNTPKSNFSKLIKKSYPIGLLNYDDAQSVLDSWHKKIEREENVIIKYNTDFLNFEKNKKGIFKIYFKYEKDSFVQNMESDFLIIANGRKGFQWLNKNIDRFDIEHNKPKISIGFRFIMPNYILENISTKHLDFKVSMYHGKYKYKTFCFSASKLGGRIKHANHGEFMLIDGHAITNKNEMTEFSNFAILSQIYDTSDNFPSFDWTKQNIINPFIKLNSKFPGKPVLQSYLDFKDDVITKLSYDHLLQLNSKIYDVGKLSSLIPEKQKQGFCLALEDLMFEFCRISNIDEPIQSILSKITVLGLELESIWNEIILTPNMETSISNLYTVGDCAGIAQGILQASIGGVVAASDISNKVLEQNQ